MKKRSFVIDKALFEVIDTIKEPAFTTCGLRDLFAARLEQDGIKGVAKAELRLHVYEHLRRMEKAGWVVVDKERRKRDQLYHLCEVPSYLAIELRAGKYYGGFSVPDGLDRPQEAQDTILQIQSLRNQLKELELDMLSSMGEVERYKLLIAEMPEMTSRLEPSLVSAREKSSKLVGHFRAVENTIQLIQAS